VQRFVFFFPWCLRTFVFVRQVPFDICLKVRAL
jgi:hypothetical protein